MAIYQEIPEDVWILILSCLPVKSLLRFKSVSKHWYSLIQNPSLISLNHNRAADCLIVKRYRDSISTLCLVFNETHFHDLYLPFASPEVGSLKVGSLCLLGSANGIVCLNGPSYTSSKYVLWNPAMRESRALPQPPYHTWRTNIQGFGFDSKTGDYKVLRVASSKVQIYDMSTDSWREIIAMLPNASFRYYEHGSFIWLDGVFHWMAVDRNGGGYCIIVFHMFDELFEQVILHEDVCINGTSRLCVMGDSLALVTSEFNSCLQIWVRDGKGVKDPWNRRCSIGPILGNHYALGFQQNIEPLLLLWDRFNSMMVSYNLDTGETKEYYDLRFYWLRVIFYKESLVSVKRVKLINMQGRSALKNKRGVRRDGPINNCFNLET